MPFAKVSDKKKEKKEEEEDKKEDVKKEDVVFDEKAMLNELELEAKEWDKDAEIDRILKAFRLDAYAVMGLKPGVPDSDIQKVYRKKSLLIHPDKTKNPQAPDAFDRLKKAQGELLDEKHRERLDEAIGDARHVLLKEKGLTVNSEELQTEEFDRAWAEKTKVVLVDYELRRKRQRDVTMREEGRLQKKEDDQIAERKRKREHEEAWENTREQRIGSWRDFKKGQEAAKKKKTKIKTLG